MDDRKDKDDRHGEKVNDSERKPIAKQVHNPGKLSGLVHSNATQQRQQQDGDNRRVGDAVPCVDASFGVFALLQGLDVVTADIAMLPALGEQNIHAIPEQVQREEPHGGKVPVPSASQPTAQQANEGKVKALSSTKHRISIVNLQPTRQHEKQADDINPVEQSGRRCLERSTGLGNGR